MSDNVVELDFETILRQTQACIRAYIAGMGIRPHEVDDLAQEVYLALYRNSDKMPAEVSVDRWLKGIARNLCLNHIRRSSRRGRLHREALTEILARANTQSERLAAEKPLWHALDECCRKLPAKSRRILAMRRRQDLPSPAIAKAMKSSAQAIRVALYRIRVSLKDCISRKLSREP